MQAIATIFANPGECIYLTCNASTHSTEHRKVNTLSESGLVMNVKLKELITKQLKSDPQNHE